MSFFDNVKETVSNTSREVGNKAKELAEVTKLKNAISAEERKIKEEYEKIGRLYVENFATNADVMFLPSIDKITNSQKVIELKQAELNQVKNVKICPNCGAAIDEGSAFCSKCGSKA
ncbi:MAG: zinc-ribbon domain-containing protein [Lachnospiraceae bacterium]|nr:zinc-ribbon domain-containing protein [Lachnospiraceae bacterium]